MLTLAAQSSAFAYEADNRDRNSIPAEMRASTKCNQYYVAGKKLKDAGKLELGERYLLAALSDADASRNDQACDWVAIQLTSMATRYTFLKKYQRAESVLKTLVATKEKYAGKVSPKLAPYLQMLASNYTAEGKTAEAAEALKRLETLR